MLIRKVFSVGLVLMCLCCVSCSLHKESVSTTVRPTQESVDNSEYASSIEPITQPSDVYDNANHTNSTEATQFCETYGVPIFAIEEYQSHVTQSVAKDWDIHVGEIDSRESAAEKARQVFKEYMEYEEDEGKSLKLFFDPDADCWLAILAITQLEAPDGLWPYLDCEPCVIMQSDGQVLALWTQ